LNNHRETRRIGGVVKWFDPQRGFGFVVADEGGPDILLHANVLRNFGQNSVADGSRVDISIQKTDRGVQAVVVHAIDPPRPATGAVLEDFEALDPAEIRAAPLLPARVKWFDKAKGFGFANIFGKPEDVFVHIEVLRASGLADLAPGEALAMRVIKGKRGQMATEINSWETAIGQTGDEAGKESHAADRPEERGHGHMDGKWDRD